MDDALRSLVGRQLVGREGPQGDVVGGLTALDDRASMRRGMTSGADDYLAKPFTRVELLDALGGILKKRTRVEESIQSAVQAREEHLRRAFTDSLGGKRAPDKFGLQAPLGAVADQVIEATVLFSDIRNFTSLAEKLSSNEVAELLTYYFERSCEPVLTNGGRHLKFIADGHHGVPAEVFAGERDRLCDGWSGYLPRATVVVRRHDVAVRHWF